MAEVACVEQLHQCSSPDAAAPNVGKRLFRPSIASVARKAVGGKEQGLRAQRAASSLLLPTDSMGDAILTDIKADMPDVDVVPWSFEMDGPKVLRPRGGSAHTGLIYAHAEYLRPGEGVPMTAVQRALLG